MLKSFEPVVPNGIFYQSFLYSAELSLTFNIPPNTLWVISGTGFYGSNDPTNSVKALKEDTRLN